MRRLRSGAKKCVTPESIRVGSLPADRPQLPSEAFFEPAAQRLRSHRTRCDAGEAPPTLLPPQFDTIGIRRE